MKNYRKLKNAFSLIELSIVILIVGILVAGVTSSSRLIKRMKITTAQNLTQSSPVPSIKDLSVWYESSLEKSFIDSEESDGTPITTWFDNNIQSSFKYDFKQATLANQPKFSEGIINNLPALKFDGVDDHMLASSVGISGKGLTAFIVGQRVAYGGSFQVSLAGLAAGQTDDTNSGSVVAFADFGTSFISGTSLQWFTNGVTHQGNGSPYILDTVFSGTGNLIYLNGVPGSGYGIATSFILDSLRVGCKFSTAPAYFFNGYIAEVIIYSRALNTEERKAVEGYLSKKYAIKVA
jgi:prepilin-type N-terminal cleavage/methylation domain-containing protein